jgi:hypothetical protein
MIRISCDLARMAALAALLSLAAASSSAQVMPQPAAPAGAGRSTAGSAGAPEIDAHRRDDIVRHRAIAAAHEAAARCLEAGRPESDCHDALRKACGGLAVGRYCGMKHRH